MDYSTPGFLVLHYLWEFAQTHVHCVSDVLQPSHPLLPLSPLALKLSQHQGLFQWVGSSSLSLRGHLNQCLLPGAVMGGPARDEVMKKIPGRQGRPGPHPWRGHKEKTWQARPSRIRDPPGWPRPLPHPVSSPLFCCCSCLPCCRFLCCLPRALLLLLHWMRTNLKP